jgi:pectate lyase
MTDGYGGFQWTTSDWHFLSNGSGSGTTHLALSGSVLTLTATPAAGSPWVGWSGAATGVARTITVTVDQPLTIQANFR